MNTTDNLSLAESYYNAMLAKDFYLKYGYEIFGVLENFPAEHKRYFMKKIL